MGYPVAYRPAASPSGGGFQSPTYGNAGPPVMPSSNDNLPRPANDNVRDALRAANAVRKALRWARFMNPYLSFALTAWDVYEWYNSRQAQAGGWNLTGWTPYCDNGMARDGYVAVAPSCDTGAGRPFGASEDAFGKTIILGSSEWVSFYRNRLGNNFNVSAIYRRAVEPNPVPLELPDIPPMWQPMPEPFIDAHALPAFIPAANPVPGPRPGRPLPPPKPLPVWSIPYRSPNPWVNPREQPQWGPTPEPDPWRPPNFRPRIDPRVHPRNRPRTRPRNDPRFEPFIPPRPNSQDPEPSLVEVLQPGYKPQYAYQSHVRRRPPLRTKEKKLYDHKGMWRLYKALGVATEIGDFVDAFWDALPAKYRKPNPDGPISLSEKLWILYKHLDEIDQWEAMKNYLDNDMEDKAIGAYQGAGAKGAVGVGATPLGPAI